MRPDPARRTAFDALRQVNGSGAYANLALGQLLGRRDLSARDAAFATELVAGTARAQGTYDLIISAAAARPIGSFQPAVVDLLRLGTHQLLAMRVPQRAGVAATVELARATVGNRVTGLVNAVLRKISEQTLDQWIQELVAKDPGNELAISTMHPAWIVEAYLDLLGDEARQALEANNLAPEPTLVVRPGLAEVTELGGEPTRYSPFGASCVGPPNAVEAVAQGRAGVQDEGSQLVAWALSRVEAPSGPWLDMCAGPGGKSALLAGLAAQQGEFLLASEALPHRAQLVADSLRGYQNPNLTTAVCADGLKPAWRPGTFARVLVDVPCTGLGALRRRPEARWRKKPADLADLSAVQLGLLRSAVASAKPGGVVAYVTCSPHQAETVQVVETVLADGGTTLLDAQELLPEVPDAALGRCVQLWPHRHGTDAMFLALLRIGNLDQ